MIALATIGIEMIEYISVGPRIEPIENSVIYMGQNLNLDLEDALYL